MKSIILFLSLVTLPFLSFAQVYHDEDPRGGGSGGGGGSGIDTSSLPLDTASTKVIVYGPSGFGYNHIMKFRNTVIPRGTYDTIIVNLALWNAICRSLSTYDLYVNSTVSAMYVGLTGRVGFGTQSPLGKIHSDAGTGNNNDFWMTNGSTSGATSTDGFRIRFSSARAVSLWNFENAAMEFGTNNNSRVTIGADGIITSTSGRVIAVQNIVSAEGTTVLTTANHFVCVTGSTTHTLTLPAATNGQMLIIKNRSSGNVTVNRSGSNTIDGGTSTTLTTGQSITLIANSGDWTIN